MNWSDLTQVHWHQLDIDKTFSILQSSKDGLSQEAAKERLKNFGPNHLPSSPKENFLWIFLRQFHNPLIYILLLSTFLALSLGKVIDASVIFGVVLLNTLIGFIQEYRSNQAIQALLKMIPQYSNVLRNGRLSSIHSTDLVPGDILVLQAGDRVSADIRLFAVKNLECDESSLTGESAPTPKHTSSVALETTIADQKCMAFNGTLVTKGTGSGIVTSTGRYTEFGKISELLKQVPSEPTPLTKTLAGIAKYITLVVFILSLLLFGIGYLRGYSMLDAVLASITLAVAAIPEGLPATITIAASIGVQRMAKRQAIIRHLLAVETLGSTTVICTDKTGTLTQNEMTVQSIWHPTGTYFVTGVGYLPDGQIQGADLNNIQELLLGALLCNDASFEQENNKWVVRGDPTELALVVVSRKGGLKGEETKNLWPRIDVIPF